MFRVLVVDDEEKIRECFAQFLSLKGYQVQEASNGAQAVSVATRESFDVIVMDIRMPLLDGVSACRHIHQIAPSTKVVLLTGLPKPREGQAPLEETAVMCLHKPVLLQDLEQIVGRVCAGEPPGWPDARTIQN